MLRLVSIAFEQHIRLADCICFGVHFLSKQMDRYILSLLLGKRQEPVLCNGKHTACTAGPVITRIGGIFNLSRNRHKDKVCHQFNNITGCPVFPCFLVVVLIEFANQFLKNRTHTVIVQSGVLHDSLGIILIDRLWGEVDIRRDKFLNHRPQNIRLNHRVNLVAELELLQDFLYIGRKTIQISFKVSFQRLLLCAAGQITQAERRCITECLSRSIA